MSNQNLENEEIDIYTSQHYPSIIAFRDEIRRFGSHFGDKILLVGVDNDWNGEAKIFGESADNHGGYAPTCVVGLLTFMPERLKLLAKLREQLGQCAGHYFPSARLLSSRQDLEVIAAATRTAVQNLLQQSVIISDLTREMYALRGRNETLQNKYHDLEILAERAGIEPINKVFESPPAFELKESDNINFKFLQSLTQVLPVESRGVAAVEIYVTELGSSEVQVEVTLQAKESGQTLGVWVMQANQLRLGWNTFALRETPTDRRTLELRLSFRGEGTAPRFSLGEVQPVETYRLRWAQTGDAIDARSLALRIYIGIPGYAIAEWASQSNRAMPRESRITGTLLKGTVLHLNEETVGPNTLQVKNDQILVNINSADAAWIKIPAVIGPRTTRISTTVSLNIEAEYSVTITAHTKDETNSMIISHPGTRTVPPGGTSWINIYFSKRTDKVRDLLLKIQPLTSTVIGSGIVRLSHLSELST